MMTHPVSTIVLLLTCLLAFVGAEEEPQEVLLTERLMKLSVVAARLSTMAYASDLTQWRVNGTEEVLYEHPDYDSLEFFNEEPDQAIVAKVKETGHCVLAFRGTNANFDDWSQNINLNDRDLFQDNDPTSPNMCEGRAGFGDFLDSQVILAGTDALFRCVESCADPSDCVVLTGHSQGGATATQSSILVYSAQPIVITFGQPPAVDDGCDELIPSGDRYLRFINSKAEKGEDDDIAFDPVVYSPAFFSKSVQYGTPLLLGGDDFAVKRLEDDFKPSLSDRQNEIDAHSMGPEKEFSYQSRVERLLSEATTFPISTAGFSDGTICERDYHELCASNRCMRDFVCGSTVDELCIKESCREADDCEGETVCIYGACAVADKMVEIDCPCRFDGQCASGQCDQSLFNFDWKCWDTADGDEPPPANSTAPLDDDDEDRGFNSTGTSTATSTTARTFWVIMGMMGLVVGMLM